MDFNTSYSSPVQRLAAAQSAIRNTMYGRGGVVKVELDNNNNVKFFVTSTKQTVNSLEEAINTAMAAGVNEVVSFSPFAKKGAGALNDATRLIDGFGAASEIFRNIGSKASGLTPDQKNVLRMAGIDIDNIQNLTVDLMFMGGDKSGTKTLADRIIKMRQSGSLNGVSIIDDKGARVMQFRQGQTVLDPYQTNLLLTMTNHDLYDNNKIFKALDLDYGRATKEEMDAAAGKIAGSFEKAGKRIRAFTSSRDISVASGELEKMIRKFRPGSRKLEDISLILDPQHELLSRFADTNFDFAYNKNAAGLRAYYSSVDPNQEITNILDSLSTKFKNGGADVNDLKAAINAFNSDSKNLAQGEFISDRLNDYLMKNFAKGNKNRQTIVQNIFESIEKSYDGSDMLNRDFLRKHVAELQNKKKDLIAGFQSLTPAEQNARTKVIAEIDSQIRRIDEGELSQITGRPRMYIEQLGEYKNIKNALDASKEFEGDLSRFGLIVSKFSAKGDTSIAGDVSSFIISGIGTPKDIVYTDPILNAFHGEIFGGEQTLRSIEGNIAKVAQEFQATLKSGTIPPKVLKMIQRQADMDIDMLPATSRASALRNRQMMQEILEMHKAGASPSDTPRLANLIFNFYTTQAYKEDVTSGVLQPAIPNFYRFGLNTERNNAKLGTGFDVLSDGISIPGEASAFARDASIMKFRIEGHNILLPNHAVGVFHHSLGGFDLDDKGLPRLITYTDGANRRRLGSYIFRQPTGTEEVIFARMRMDQQTIRGLFGNDDVFSDTLDELMDLNKGKMNGSVYQTIRRYLDTEHGNEFINPMSDEIEAALADVLDTAARKGLRTEVSLTKKAAEKIAKHGSSSLALSDLVYMKNGKAEQIIPGYSTQGIYKTMLENDVFDFSPEFKSFIQGSSHIETGIKNQLMGANSMHEVMQMLNELDKTGRGKQARAIINSVIEHTTLARSAESNLGKYINRSTVIGSTLDQFSDIIDGVLSQGASGKKLVDYIGNNFKIGLMAQESAIDIAVNSSMSKSLVEASRNILTKQAFVNEAKLGTTIGALAGYSGPVTIDQIGSAAMENLGRQIGFIRSLNLQGLDEDVAKLGIDPLVIMQQMKGDSKLLAKNIILGMQNAQQNVPNLGWSLVDDLDEKLKELIKVSNTDNEDLIREHILSNYALTSDSKYAASTRIQNLAKKGESLFRSYYNAHVSSIQVAPEILTAEASIQERRMAEFITNKHQKDLLQMKEYIGIRGEVEDSLTTAMMNARMQKVGQTILEDIDAASKVEGITFQGLVNALDQTMMPRGMDIGGLQYPIGDLGEVAGNINPIEMMQKINFARRVTRNKYYRDFDTSTAEQVLSTLKASVTDTTGKTADDLAKIALQNMDDNVPSDIRNIISTLAGKSDIQSEIIQQDADLQASIVRSLVDYEGFDQSQLATLNAVGTLDAADESIGLSDDMVRAIVDSVSDPQTPITNKAVYKRISEKLKQGEPFRDLIESPTVKKTAMAVGALVVASFVYQHHKGRSNDDMTGPPMLPGGSAYETDYPNHIPEIGFSAGDTYNPGVTYNVNLYGDQRQIRQFNSAVGGVSNANINTTMYNRIPDVGRDPYGSIASSF